MGGYIGTEMQYLWDGEEVSRGSREAEKTAKALYRQPGEDAGHKGSWELRLE